MTFLILAVATASVMPAQSEPISDSSPELALQRWFPARAVTALMVGVVVWGSILPGVASAYAATGAMACGRGNPDKMLTLMTRAQRLATPYRDDQLHLVSQCILALQKKNAFETWRQHGASLALVQSIANQHFANIASHNRFRRLYARVQSYIGQAENDAQMLARAERLYLQNTAESPKRQQYIMDYAKFLAETGRLDQAESQYRRAIALDPSVGEPRWELGKFVWTYRKRPDQGARMMVRLVLISTRPLLTSTFH